MQEAKEDWTGRNFGRLLEPMHACRAGSLMPATCMTGVHAGGALH